MSAEVARQAGTRTEAEVIPSLGKDNTGRYSDTARTTDSLNHTAIPVSYSTKNLRRMNRSWSGSLYRIDCYVPQFRDIIRFEVHPNSALARENILHQHAEEREPRVRGVVQDQPQDETQNRPNSDIEPVCTQLTLHHTAMGTVSITFHKRAAELHEAGN